MPPKLANVFLLVDCNNFYVSCERVFRPDLADKPVMVLSNNDGCVIARSPKVKRQWRLAAAGVRSGIRQGQRDGEGAACQMTVPLWAA